MLRLRAPGQLNKKKQFRFLRLRMFSASFGEKLARFDGLVWKMGSLHM